jgi:hypothetical protein
MNSDDFINFNIKKLVETIGNLPGIETVSSCGGHEEITDRSQVPENNFYISFKFIEEYPSRSGWELLRQLMGVIWESYEKEEIKIELQTTADNYLFFTLHGHNINPNDLADVLGGVPI